MRLKPFTLLLLAALFSDLVSLISKLYSFKCAHRPLDSGHSLECLFVLGCGCLWCHFPRSSLWHSCYAPLLFCRGHLVDVALRSPTLFVVLLQLCYWVTSFDLCTRLQLVLSVLGTMSLLHSLCAPLNDHSIWLSLLLYVWLFGYLLCVWSVLWSIHALLLSSFGILGSFLHGLGWSFARQQSLLNSLARDNIDW